MQTWINLKDNKRDIPKWGVFISILLFTVLTSYASFGMGFDFTDYTLHYHFALRILDGDVPFIDFHSAVMPLSYYIEALVHYLFGLDYKISLYLGLFFKFIDISFIYFIVNYFYKEKATSLIFTLFIVALFMGNTQSHFSFSTFAITLSLIIIYLSIIARTRVDYLFVGIFVGLSFLNKQNYGVLFSLSFVFYFFVLYIKKYFTFKEIVEKSIFFALGFFVVIFPFFIYFYTQGALSEIVYILSTGGERKGLSSQTIVEIVDSIVPILTYKVFLAGVVASLLVAFLFLQRSKKVFLLAIVFLLSYIAFIQPFILFYNPVKPWYSAVELIFFDAVKILLFMAIVYSIFFAKNISKELLFVFIGISTVIVTNELGWAGRNYTTPVISSIFIVLLPYIILYYRGNKNFDFQVDILKKSILIYLIFFTFLAIFFTKDIPRKEFNVNDKITLEPFLSNYNISKEHKKAILDIKSIYESSCKNRSIFVFHWAPIFYDILGVKNPTRFDLPNSDWLLFDESVELIGVIQNEHPCMLLVNEITFTEENTSPFPAKGMMNVKSFLRNDFLNFYNLVETVEIHGQNYQIYIEK